VFEQDAGFGTGEAARFGFGLRTHKAVSRGHAHREELVAMLLAQMQMPMPFECGKEDGQERDQSFRTDMIGGSPGGKQRVQNFFSIEKGALTRQSGFFGMVQELQSMFAGVAGNGDTFIEHACFLCARGLLIARSQMLDDFSPRLHAQGWRHGILFRTGRR